MALSWPRTEIGVMAKAGELRLMTIKLPVCVFLATQNLTKESG